MAKYSRRSAYPQTMWTIWIVTAITFVNMLCDLFADHLLIKLVWWTPTR